MAANGNKAMPDIQLTRVTLEKQKIRKEIKLKGQERVIRRKHEKNKMKGKQANTDCPNLEITWNKRPCNRV